MKRTKYSRVGVRIEEVRSSNLLSSTV